MHNYNNEVQSLSQQENASKQVSGGHIMLKERKGKNSSINASPDIQRFCEMLTGQFSVEKRIIANTNPNSPQQSLTKINFMNQQIQKNIVNLNTNNSPNSHQPLLSQLNQLKSLNSTHAEWRQNQSQKWKNQMILKVLSGQGNSNNNYYNNDQIKQNHDFKNTMNPYSNSTTTINYNKQATQNLLNQNRQGTPFDYEQKNKNYYQQSQNTSNINGLANENQVNKRILVQLVDPNQLFKKRIRDDIAKKQGVISHQNNTNNNFSLNQPPQKMLNTNGFQGFKQKQFKTQKSWKQQKILTSQAQQQQEQKSIQNNSRGFQSLSPQLRQNANATTFNKYKTKNQGADPYGYFNDPIFTLTTQSFYKREHTEQYIERIGSTKDSENQLIPSETPNQHSKSQLSKNSQNMQYEKTSNNSVYQIVETEESNRIVQEIKLPQIMINKKESNTINGDFNDDNLIRNEDQRIRDQTYLKDIPRTTNPSPFNKIRQIGLFQNINNDLNQTPIKLQKAQVAFNFKKPQFVSIARELKNQEGERPSLLTQPQDVLTVKGYQGDQQKLQIALQQNRATRRNDRMQESIPECSPQKETKSFDNCDYNQMQPAYNFENDLNKKMIPEFFKDKRMSEYQCAENKIGNIQIQESPRFMDEFQKIQNTSKGIYVEDDLYKYEQQDIQQYYETEEQYQIKHQINTPTNLQQSQFSLTRISRKSQNYEHQMVQKRLESLQNKSKLLGFAACKIQSVQISPRYLDPTHIRQEILKKQVSHINQMVKIRNKRNNTNSSQQRNNTSLNESQDFSLADDFLSKPQLFGAKLQNMKDNLDPLNEKITGWDLPPQNNDILSPDHQHEENEVNVIMKSNSATSETLDEKQQTYGISENASEEMDYEDNYEFNQSQGIEDDDQEETISIDSQIERNQTSDFQKAQIFQQQKQNLQSKVKSRVQIPEFFQLHNSTIECGTILSTQDNTKSLQY